MVVFKVRIAVSKHLFLCKLRIDLFLIHPNPIQTQSETAKARELNPKPKSKSQRTKASQIVKTKAKL